jgi:hypothetical protein
MHHFCEQQQAQRRTWCDTQEKPQAAWIAHTLAHHTTQMAHHQCDLEDEQLEMMGDRGLVQTTNLGATASYTERVEVGAVAVTQVPAAVPLENGMPRGNKLEGPSKYDGKQTKSWKPGCPPEESQQDSTGAGSSRRNNRWHPPGMCTISFLIMRLLCPKIST